MARIGLRSAWWGCCVERALETGQQQVPYINRAQKSMSLVLLVQLWRREEWVRCNMSALASCAGWGQP